jgi:hypothetical protein
MIAGANKLGHWITLNGQTVGGQYVYAAHGSTTAGPMWGDAMHVIQQWLPNTDFVPPNANEINGVLTSVPDVSGMPYDQASQQLQQAGFTVADGGYRDSGNPADTVAYTDPAAGAQIPSGSAITIYRSDGTPAPPPKHHHGGNNGPGGGDHGPPGGGGNGPPHFPGFPR